MELAQHKHGDCICGRDNSCQVSQKEDTGVEWPHSLQKVLVISAQKLLYPKFGHIGVPEENSRDSVMRRGHQQSGDSRW